MFELEYDMFCKFQKKDLQYSSEKEIKEYLSNWRAVILQCRNPVELIRKADELIFWTEILSEATVDIVSIYSEQFEDLMWNYAKDNSWSLLSDSLFYGETKSKILLSASKKVISRLRERRIVEYIHEILTSDDIELKISCSRELKICFNDLEYKDIVIGNCKKLLVDDSFPLGSISAEQYLLCTNILYILKKALAEEYRSYVTGLLTRCDKMDKYRIEKIDKIIDQQI